jgi:serine/threonine protein kinase
VPPFLLCAGVAASLEFTLAYAAPEIVAAYEAGKRTEVVDSAADVWALGVIAFELLTDTRTFPADTQASAIIDALLGRAALPWEGPQSDELLPKLRMFRRTVLDCLNRDAAQRPKIKAVVLAWRGLFSAAVTESATRTTGVGGTPWQDLPHAHDSAN